MTYIHITVHAFMVKGAVYSRKDSLVCEKSTMHNSVMANF